jgi:hypothetical protein
LQDLFIVRAGIIIEYQLQVRDVFSIHFEARCVVGSKPSVEVQNLRACALRLKNGKPHQSPSAQTEAVRQHVIEPCELQIIEILVQYLCKYLQTRQMALLVRHIRSLQISNPPQEMIDRFEEGTATTGSAGQG